MWSGALIPWKLIVRLRMVGCGYRNRERSSRCMLFHCTRKQLAVHQVSPDIPGKFGKAETARETIFCDTESLAFLGSEPVVWMRHRSTALIGTSSSVTNPVDQAGLRFILEWTGR